MNKTVVFAKLTLMFALYFIAVGTGQMNFFYAGSFVLGSLAYDIHKAK